MYLGVRVCEAEQQHSLAKPADLHFLRKQLRTWGNFRNGHVRSLALLTTVGFADSPVLFLSPIS